MTPFEEYCILLKKLHEVMVSGQDTDDGEGDKLRDKMDGPWYDMTDEERKQTRELSVQLYKEAEAKGIKL